MHVTSLPQLACASWRWGTREQASFRTTSSSSTCLRRRYSLYLLYWYKSANTDATRAPQHVPTKRGDWRTEGSLAVVNLSIRQRMPLQLAYVSIRQRMPLQLLGSGTLVTAAR